MTLQELLRGKGTQVHTIAPDATLDDVVQSLMQHRCGSLIVCEGGERTRMVGIITERDIMRACAERRTPLSSYRVRDYMTSNPVTGSPRNTLDDAMAIMTERRIRHLPIVDGEELIGMISIGDAVKARHHLAEVENHYLKTYIHG
jgi:CBS domain-containing protein